MSTDKSLPPDAPPPYYPSAASSSTSTSNPPAYPPLTPSLISSHLHTHLASLPQRIRASQAAHSTAQATTDLDLVTRLAPELESFLADLAARPRVPLRAELTLVPAPAVLAAWALSGADERRREGEVVQLVRVPGPEAPDEKARGDAKRPDPAVAETDFSGPQFDSWGRDINPASSSSAAAAETWWWGDEAQARRLAAHLNPPRDVSRPAVAAAVVAAKEERRGGWASWGRRKEAAPAPVAVRAAAPTDDERVSMVARAEEVTFRRENDFGVWESLTGWGIVVRVRIRRT